MREFSNMLEKASISWLWLVRNEQLLLLEEEVDQHDFHCELALEPCGDKDVTCQSLSILIVR